MITQTLLAWITSQKIIIISLVALAIGSTIISAATGYVETRIYENSISAEVGETQVSGDTVASSSATPEATGSAEPETPPTKKAEIPKKAAETPQPPLTPYVSPENKLPSATEVAAFQAWADARGIILQAVTATVDEMYYNSYVPATHNTTLANIPGLVVAYNGLKIIPDAVLDVMRTKVIYLSTASGRPYTNLSGEYGGILKNTKSGIILTQTLSAHNSVHEFGHIAHYHGIESIYDSLTEPNGQWGAYLSEFNRIFDTTGIEYPSSQTAPGYYSNYAQANKAENFAEHFAYYVLDGTGFRGKGASDTLLQQKYNFLKNYIFTGTEY